MAPRIKRKRKPPIINEESGFKLRCPTAKKVKELSMKQQFGRKDNNVALLRADDFTRSALIDTIVGFSVNKCYKDYQKLPQHIEEAIKSLLYTNVICGNSEEICKTIVYILKQFMEGEILETIVSNYMKLFNINTGVTIGICTEYDTENNLGLKLVSTRNWQPGEFLDLHNLTSLFDGTPQEANTYSTSLSLPDREKDRFWLGPSAIINHSCSPNAEFVSWGEKTLVKILKPIKVGEEVFVHYGSDYFDPGQCQCKPCKNEKIVEEQGYQESSTTRYAFRKRPESIIPQPAKLEEVLPIYENLFHNTVLTPELKSEWEPMLDLMRKEVKIIDKEALSDVFSEVNNTQGINQMFGNSAHVFMGLGESRAQLSKDLIDIAVNASSIGLSLLDSTDGQSISEKLLELKRSIKNAARVFKNHEGKEKKLKEVCMIREQERQAKLRQLKDGRNSEEMLPKLPGTEREGLDQLAPSHQRLVCKLFKWPMNDMATPEVVLPEPDAIEDRYNGNGSPYYVVPHHSPLLQNSSTTSATSSMERETTPIPKRPRKRTYKSRKNKQGEQVVRKTGGRKGRKPNLKRKLDSNAPSTSVAYEHDNDTVFNPSYSHPAGFQNSPPREDFAEPEPSTRERMIREDSEPDDDEIEVIFDNREKPAPSYTAPNNHFNNQIYPFGQQT